MNATDKTDRTYNGWTNYETWNIHLWLTNEQGTDSYWREAAKELWDAAGEETHEVWTRSENARFTLADRLKDEIEDGNPLLDEASMYQDLLSAAISEADWAEIANAFLDGIEGYESAE
jgi:hypothetical protein